MVLYSKAYLECANVRKSYKNMRKKTNKTWRGNPPQLKLISLLKTTPETMQWIQKHFSISSRFPVFPLSWKNLASWWFAVFLRRCCGARGSVRTADVPRDAPWVCVRSLRKSGRVWKEEAPWQTDSLLTNYCCSC